MPLPQSIRDRDGKSEPFDAERIARRLFGATETLGTPDPFLARELTDGVLHFLEVDEFLDPLPVLDLLELIVKVVRELGHPALARVLEDRSRPNPLLPAPAVEVFAPQPSAEPWSVIRQAAAIQLEKYSLTEVYPRDLVSAHHDGLLILGDLEHPFELMGIVNRQPVMDIENVLAVRRLIGSVLAIQGAAAPTLDRLLEVMGLKGVINWNLTSPLPWATTGPGNLFQVDPAVENRPSLSDSLDPATGQTVFWHLSDRDFRDEETLQAMVRQASAYSNLEFVFDRMRRPIVLGPGLTQSEPAAVSLVRLNLMRFVKHLGGGPLEPDLFQRKLVTFVRFVRSAGDARRAFLRSHGRPELLEGFLLERSVAVIEPVGVIAAAKCVLGIVDDWDAIIHEAARSLATIRHVLENDPTRPAPTRIDFGLQREVEELDEPTLLPRQRIRYASDLAAAAGRGCLTLRLNGEEKRDLPALLHAAWKSDLTRMKIV